MKINCPRCTQGLTSFFLLSRWNPYLFHCPHCSASLAFVAASKWVTTGVVLAPVMVSIGIYLEETEVLPKFGGLVFGLTLSVALLFLLLLHLQRQGRLRVELAQDRSHRAAGRYDYALVILAPAFLLLLLGLGAFVTSMSVPATNAEHHAKQEIILEQVKAGALPPEQKDHLITSGIEADRALAELYQATKRLLSFVGWLLSALAIWLLIAGYFALRRRNKRIQPMSAPSEPGRG